MKPAPMQPICQLFDAGRRGNGHRTVLQQVGGGEGQEAAEFRDEPLHGLVGLVIGGMVEFEPVCEEVAA